MTNTANKIEETDWNKVASDVHEKGYALLPDFLSEQQCQDLIDNYDAVKIYRKTVVMERYRFGLGEYKYFDYPLPELVQLLRTGLYPKLAPIANTWMEQLNIAKQFPEQLSNMLAKCKTSNQAKPTPLILKYGQGGFNTLHQDLYGEVYFPLQTAFFLNQAGIDFSGGEFVLTQQIPRSQSKAIVLSPQKGDMLIFANNFRPAKGKRGYYRVTTKHGVSEVSSGERHTLGVIFHDAEN